MTTKGIWKTILAAMGVVLVLCTCAATPVLVFQMQDAQQFQQPLTRRRLDSRLSADGQDIYLVRTLHQRAAQAGSETGFAPANMPRQQIQQQMENVLWLLAEAEMVPNVLPDNLIFLPENTPNHYSCLVDSFEIQQFQCVMDAYFSPFIGLEFEQRAGKVIRFWATLDTEAAAGFDAGKFLQRYIVYLGLDRLDDWTVADSQYYDALLRSEKGLVQVYCGLNHGMVLFGVAALPV